MNAAEFAERLIDLTKSWDVAGALLGLMGTVISQADDHTKDPNLSMKCLPN